jgi:hypothetical protein
MENHVDAHNILGDRPEGIIQMQTTHSSAVKLDALAPGQAFRFYFRDEQAIGLRAQFPGGGSAAALALTSTNSFHSGALLSGFDVGDVIPLAGAKIVPSTKPGTVAPGKGHFAQAGELELHGGRLFYVTVPHAEEGIIFRVDLQSGDIGRSSGLAPVEIYSQWSILDGAGETVHEHAPAPPDRTESIVVAV